MLSSAPVLCVQAARMDENATAQSGVHSRLRGFRYKKLTLSEQPPPPRMRQKKRNFQAKTWHGAGMRPRGTGADALLALSGMLA